MQFYDEQLFCETESESDWGYSESECDSDGRGPGVGPQLCACARVCRGVPRDVCVRAPEGLRGR